MLFGCTNGVIALFLQSHFRRKDYEMYTSYLLCCPEQGMKKDRKKKNPDIANAFYS
jgi:hypothetical protein